MMFDDFVSGEKSISDFNTIPGERRDKGPKFGAINGDIYQFSQMINDLPHRIEPRLVCEHTAIKFTP